MKQNSKGHWKQVYFIMYAVLPALSVVFLVLEHVTHFEFLLHLAAIPLEILLGAFLVERFLARKEKQAKRNQLMYIKSYILRSEMRQVFLSNFRALESPPITIEGIRHSSLEELHGLRASAQHLKYRSIDDLEDVILAYVKSYGVFHTFLEWAIANDFEEIFHDMLHILHFIQDVKLFKSIHPDRFYMHEVQCRPDLLDKVFRILTQGVIKFLDYAIELKEKQPDVFDELMADYEASFNLGSSCGAETPGPGTTDSEVALEPRMASHPGIRLMNISP